MVLAQLGGDVTFWGEHITAAPNTYREIVSEMEPGSSQCCTVGGQETMDLS